MKSPEISIIIPVYGVENYIKKCLQSILNQSFTSFETIIIDDGTPDKSILIAKKLVDNDPRFIFLEKENGGQASARNLGLDNARGHYIAFLDADDYLHSEFLSKMYKAIITSNSDIAICNIKRVSTEGETISTISNNVKKYYSKNDIFLCLNTISSYPCDKLYKADIFKNIRYDAKVRTYEDTHLIFRLVYNKRITNIEEYLYNYVQRKGSTTKSLPTTLIKDKLSIIKCYKDFLQNEGIVINKKYFSYCYLYTFIFNTAAVITRYSPHYKKDIKNLLNHADTKLFSFKEIFHANKYSKKIALGLVLLKINPLLFKWVFLVKRKLKLLNKYK